MLGELFSNAFKRAFTLKLYLASFLSFAIVVFTTLLTFGIIILPSLTNIINAIITSSQNLVYFASEEALKSELSTFVSNIGLLGIVNIIIALIFALIIWTYMNHVWQFFLLYKIDKQNEDLYSGTKQAFTKGLKFFFVNLIIAVIYNTIDFIILLFNFIPIIGASILIILSIALSLYWGVGKISAIARMYREDNFINSLTTGVTAGAKHLNRYLYFITLIVMIIILIISLLLTYMLSMLIPGIFVISILFIIPLFGIYNASIIYDITQ
jgi:hypothetical protein